MHATGFPFVDVGMRHMCGKDWLNYFDAVCIYALVQLVSVMSQVVVSASKPQFFTSNKPFRYYDTTSNALDWKAVSKFEKGKVGDRLGCIALWKRA